jgi:PTS system nitrogen regulatory IIA component
MYLNLVQLAESFGVSERVVEGWVRDEGLPHTLDRGRLLFDRAQVAQWAAARGLAAHAGFLAPETPAFATGCRIESLLRAGKVWRDVPPGEVLSVLERVVAALPGVTPPILQLLGRRLRAPGGISWTPVGGGFALPHLSALVALGRDSGTVALLFLRAPSACVEKAPDGVPVTRLLFFVAPSPRAHLDLLGRFGRILMQQQLRELLARAAPDEEIFAAFAAVDAASARESGAEAAP